MKQVMRIRITMQRESRFMFRKKRPGCRGVAMTLIIIAVIFFFNAGNEYCEPFFPQITIGVDNAESPEEVSTSIQILLLLTVLALAPSILIMMTAFTRIIIVLSFLRNALALFLTLFVMMPVATEINDRALAPYTDGDIALEDALDRASGIVKEFMLKQFDDEKDLAFFTTMAGMDPQTVTPADLPLRVVIPAFIINELTIAFKIGFLIFIPFLVIDMVVSSTLMSMGMMMLPPIMISLPFKILLFIMVRGWSLVTQSIMGSFT
jgi:flagellar biosynthetic protein FliP